VAFSGEISNSVQITPLYLINENFRISIMYNQTFLVNLNMT
jgi:hypothetical protein